MKGLIICMDIFLDKTYDNIADLLEEVAKQPDWVHVRIPHMALASYCIPGKDIKNLKTAGSFIVKEAHPMVPSYGWNGQISTGYSWGWTSFPEHSITFLRNLYTNEVIEKCINYAEQAGVEVRFDGWIEI